jgi:hypothetical protein
MKKPDETWGMGHIAFTLGNRRGFEPVISYSESHDQVRYMTDNYIHL